MTGILRKRGDTHRDRPCDKEAEVVSTVGTPRLPGNHYRLGRKEKSGLPWSPQRQHSPADTGFCTLVLGTMKEYISIA